MASFATWFISALNCIPLRVLSMHTFTDVLPISTISTATNTHRHIRRLNQPFPAYSATLYCRAEIQWGECASYSDAKDSIYIPDSTIMNHSDNLTKSRDFLADDANRNDTRDTECMYGMYEVGVSFSIWQSELSIIVDRIRVCDTPLFFSLVHHNVPTAKFDIAGCCVYFR